MCTLNRSNFTSCTSGRLWGTYWCSRSDLLEDEIGDRSIGVDDDGGHFVVTDLLQQRRRVQVVIQHPDWQRLSRNEKAADQFLQSQQAWGRAKAEPSSISRSISVDTTHIFQNVSFAGPVKIMSYPRMAMHLCHLANMIDGLSNSSLNCDII